MSTPYMPYVRAARATFSPICAVLLLFLLLNGANCIPAADRNRSSFQFHRLLPEDAYADRSAVVTSSYEEEMRDVLTGFYNLTGGDTWLRNDFWNTNFSVCDWYGVCCGRVILSAIEGVQRNCNMSGLVVGLFLQRNNLSGVVSDFDFAANFPHLEAVQLSTNMLSGPLPSSIAASSLLFFLDLSVNHFHGPLWEDFGNLTRLKYIHVSQNRLTGVVPQSVVRLYGLQYLLVASNHLEGQFPKLNASDFLFHYDRAAAELGLGQDEMFGVPLGYEETINMVHFDISNNNLSASLDDVLAYSVLSSASFVDFSNNPLISGTLPSHMAHVFERAFADECELRMPSGTCNTTVFDRMVLPFTQNTFTTFRIAGTNTSGILTRHFAIEAFGGSLMDLDVSNTALNGSIPVDFLRRSQVLLRVNATNTNMRDTNALSYLDVRSADLVDVGKDTYLCPRIVLLQPEITEFRMMQTVLQLDPSYYDMKGCKCAPGFNGLPPYCRSVTFEYWFPLMCVAGMLLIVFFLVVARRLRRRFRNGYFGPNALPGSDDPECVVTVKLANRKFGAPGTIDGDVDGIATSVLTKWNELMQSVLPHSLDSYAVAVLYIDDNESGRDICVRPRTCINGSNATYLIQISTRRTWERYESLPALSSQYILPVSRLMHSTCGAFTTIMRATDPQHTFVSYATARTHTEWALLLCDQREVAKLFRQVLDGLRDLHRCGYVLVQGPQCAKACSISTSIILSKDIVSGEWKAYIYAYEPCPVVEAEARRRRAYDIGAVSCFIMSALLSKFCVAVELSTVRESLVRTVVPFYRSIVEHCSNGQLHLRPTAAQLCDLLSLPIAEHPLTPDVDIGNAMSYMLRRPNEMWQNSLKSRVMCWHRTEVTVIPQARRQNCRLSTMIYAPQRNAFCIRFHGIGDWQTILERASQSSSTFTFHEFPGSCETDQTANVMRRSTVVNDGNVVERTAVVWVKTKDERKHTAMFMDMDNVPTTISEVLRDLSRVMLIFDICPVMRPVFSSDVDASVLLISETASTKDFFFPVPGKVDIMITTPTATAGERINLEELDTLFSDVLRKISKSFPRGLRSVDCATIAEGGEVLFSNEVRIVGRHDSIPLYSVAFPFWMRSTNFMLWIVAMCDENQPITVRFVQPTALLFSSSNV